MRKLLLFVLGVTVLFSGHTRALDDSLAKKYGANRVKIKRMETPANTMDAKMRAVERQFAERREECMRSSDRSKQYCLQGAEQELMAEKRRIRDAARKKEHAAQK